MLKHLQEGGNRKVSGFQALQATVQELMDSQEGCLSPLVVKAREYLPGCVERRSFGWPLVAASKSDHVMARCEDDLSDGQCLGDGDVIPEARVDYHQSG